MTHEIYVTWFYRQLTLHQVPSDGDCMYAAVAHQMKIIQVIDIPAKECVFVLIGTYLLMMTNPEGQTILGFRVEIIYGCRAAIEL